MNVMASAIPNPDSEMVILRCPNCHSAEPVAAEAISEGVQVVICRQCGEGWAAKPEPAPERQSDCEDENGRSLVWADARTIDAVRRPLVAYAGDEPDPWARRIETDFDQPEHRSSPVFGWLIVLVSGLFLAGFFGARQQVVAAVPDLAGLYAAIGLPVNMTGLDIVEVRASAESSGFETSFRIEGAVRNITRGDMAVPALKVEFLDRYSRLVHSVPLASPVQSLRAGKQAGFNQSIKDFPKESVSVRVTFQDASAMQPVRVVSRGGG